MASQQTTVDFVVDQVRGAGSVSARKMFGEYGIYCDGKMVALICDDRLFVKPTVGGRAYSGDVIERAPYEGAKPCFLISGERVEEGEWLTALVQLTAAELPAPSKKRPPK